jgi:hypothetical protein
LYLSGGHHLNASLRFALRTTPLAGWAAGWSHCRLRDVSQERVAFCASPIPYLWLALRWVALLVGLTPDMELPQTTLALPSAFRRQVGWLTLPLPFPAVAACEPAMHQADLASSASLCMVGGRCLFLNSAWASFPPAFGLVCMGDLGLISLPYTPPLKTLQHAWAIII